MFMVPTLQHWLYRSGLGTYKELGEFVTPQYWYFPLQISWLTLASLGRVLLRQLGGDADTFVTAEHDAQITKVIESAFKEPRGT